MSKKIVNYAADMAVHPLIATHPLYKSLLSSKMINYKFSINELNENLNLIPTYYKFINQNHSIIIEDYITLFFPYIHNGSNYLIDPRTQNWFESFKNSFRNDKFRGFITHMKQTVDTLNLLFHDEEKIKNKIFYLKLASKDEVQQIKKTNKQNIQITFTNSFGGTKNNFPIRGGLESILAFKQLYEEGHKNIYLNLLGDINVEENLNKWIISCPNNNLFNSNLNSFDRNMYTEDVIENLLKQTDIFLIPACRIHSMSVVRALKFGNIVLGSDGWGFDEFIKKEFQCSGQSSMSYINDGILKEKYSLFLQQPNAELLASIKEKILNLISDCDRMDEIKKNNLEESNINFSISSRNIEFEKILERMF